MTRERKKLMNLVGNRKALGLFASVSAQRDHCKSLPVPWYRHLVLFIFLYSRFLLVIYFIHISVYMSIPISQFIPPPPPPPAFPRWCPYVCSLQLCLYFCLADQFICTIFLDSTYMLIYDICFSLFDLLHSV